MINTGDRVFFFFFFFSRVYMCAIMNAWKFHYYSHKIGRVYKIVLAKNILLKRKTYRNKKDKTSRLGSLEYWKTNISIVKAILDKLGYPEVHIVDSMSGYDLEDTEVIQGYKAVIEGREGIKESINYINWSHDSMTFLNALKQYAMHLNNNNKAKDEEISL